MGALGLLGTVAGLWFTRESGPLPGIKEPANGQRATSGNAAPPPSRQRVVDMKPLLTARRVASLATTPEEQELARQAERLADHSVDLAFAEAMRRAVDEPPEPTPEIRELGAKKAKAKAVVDFDQQRIEQLTAQSTAATSPDRERLMDELELAKAQLELDRDDLDAAADALERTGGDPQARIKRLREAYDSAQKEPRPAPAALVAASSQPASNLVGRLRAWAAQRGTVEQLTQAMREAREKAEQLGNGRQRLASKIQEAAQKREGSEKSGPSKTTPAPSTQLASDQRRLAVIGQRIQNQHDLGDVYAEWISLAEGRARALLHGLLLGVLWILLALTAAYAVSRVVDQLLQHKDRDEFRKGTVRTGAKVTIQAVAAVVVLFMVLGVPAQATTIIGLAGAGLTVAMKDFIVAFFGWFILMGRNGIRVGDWVEINGVGGEVAEIGLLHTVLLETGSWSDAGHPTGRRASFVNSFAIERHFFNFSTSGQWMWDELRVLIPLGQDPYPIIDGVQKLAREETEANAKLAEQEWLKATTRYRVRSFSAAPGVNVIPTSAGVEVNVRYITRAFERHDTRQRLYHAIVELMHGKCASGEVIGHTCSRLTVTAG